MKKGSGPVPDSPFAGLFTSSDTAGPRVEPAVTEDVTKSSSHHLLSKARSVFSARNGERSTKKRLLLMASTAATLTAAGVFSASATFGLFTATSAVVTNHLSSGTVTLTSDLTGACGVTGILPGAPASHCTLKATYSGTAPAYLALNVLIETQTGSGGTKLYNPSDSTHDLLITITDNQSSPVTYSVPATAMGTCPGGAPSGSSCYEVDNQLVNKSAFTSASPAVTFTVTASLPTGSTTGYQAGLAQVVLTAHAVQSAHNGNTAPCVLGTECDPSTHPPAPGWS